MSRVDENRDAQRVDEQRRIAEADKAKQTVTKQDFGRLVEQKRASGEQVLQQAKQQQGTQTAAKTNAQAALLARTGIQSHQFSQTLQQKGTASTETTKNTQQERRVDADEDHRLQRGEQQRGSSVKAGDNAKDEGTRAIQGDERGGRKGGGERGTEGQEMGGGQFGQQSGLAKGDGVQGGAAAQASGSAPTLPSALIREIVERIYVGVTSAGDAQFVIDLNDSALGGARIFVSSNGKNITARFQTADKDMQRLVKASEQALTRALSAKGLTLTQLAVDEGL